MAARYGMGLSTALAILPTPVLAGVQEDAQAGTSTASPPSASRYEASWTHFVGSAVSGDGDSRIVYGARLDGYATIDGRDLGLWNGLTPVSWSMALGLTGSLPLASRPRDRFGLAYFRISLSDVLREGLAPVLRLGPEQGAEAFYTFDAGNGRVRVTATAQIVDSARRAAGASVFLGLRTMLRF